MAALMEVPSQLMAMVELGYFNEDVQDNYPMSETGKASKISINGRIEGISKEVMFSEMDGDQFNLKFKEKSSASQNLYHNVRMKKGMAFGSECQ